MLIAAFDAIVNEAMLLAGICFLVGSVEDALVDVIFLGRWLYLKIARRSDPHLGSSLTDALDGRFAVIVAAWDEAPVIGQMLRTALSRFDYPDFRIYVGTYPNDPATAEIVREIAKLDSRVQLVVGERPGPTTKADCLNSIWTRLCRDEEAEGIPFRAIVLHDAEDIVHPLELRVFARHLARHAAVQLPVVPLRHPDSLFVSGHYCDEFAEAHAKQLLVRSLVGAGLPLAGVGCAIRRDMLARIGEARGGDPFDATSLTEDYELGLTIGMMGGKVLLAREPESAGGCPVAVRAYFPSDVKAAVRQKSRWMTGIALAGWDRIGWAPARHLGDHWMRMRDRRATLAIPVLLLAYVTLVLFGLSVLLHTLLQSPVPLPGPLLQTALVANLFLLVWRLFVRAIFVAHCYDWRQALWSVPRFVVGNYIALLAARRAFSLYLSMLAGAAPRWDKTTHQFPEDPEQAAP